MILIPELVFEKNERLESRLENVRKKVEEAVKIASK